MKKDKGILIIIILLLLAYCLIVVTIHAYKRKNDYQEVKKVEAINNTKEVQIELKTAPKQEIKQNKKEEKLKSQPKIVEQPKQEVKHESSSTGTYKLTHYGHDCCKSGLTATGYDVRNTIYYNDSQYGNVRIVAMCSNIPLYSIVKIKDYKLGGDITAIVIDRGVGCGTIDLLTESEAKSSQLGIQKGVEVEVLRKGK